MAQRVGSRDARLTSEGCFSCKRMKVRCDETKPQCQRCTRGNRTCPGYRDRNALIFCSPKREELSQRISPDLDPNSANWLHCAVAHFFRNFVICSTKEFPGYLELVPKLYDTEANAKWLQESVHAVSMASFALVRRMGDLYLVQARRHYGLALHSLRLALEDKQRAMSSTVLVSIALLWKYDVIIGEPGASPHHLGQSEILRMRLDCQTPDETWINRSIFASVQMHNLTHPKQELPPMSLPSTTGPGTILLNHLLPSVNAAYQQISSACDRSEILLRMMSLDCSLQQWEVNLPRQWKLETVIDGENSCLATSSNISLASMLLAHSVAHLRLVKGLTGLGVPSLQPRAVSLVDRVCSLVSYMVNRRQGKEKSQLIGAFFAIGALYTIVQLGSLPETKRDWILELLNYIGGEGGIRKALILRNRILINWPESPGYKTVVP